MREIIFRGKRTDNGEWVEGNLVWIKNYEEQPYQCFIISQLSYLEYGEFDEMYQVFPETVGQYTGLTDRNGKKIFEGDVVKCMHHWRLQKYPIIDIDEEKYFFEQKIRGAYGKGVDKENIFISCERYYYFRNYAVEYFERNSGFRVRNGGCFHALTRGYIFNRSLEIIGNIHDNPELLTGEGG